MLQAFGQPDAGQHRGCRAGRFGRVGATDLERHRDVVERTEFRQQVMELVDEAEVQVTHAALLRRVDVGDVLAEQFDAARRRCIEPAHQVEQGALA